MLTMHPQDGFEKYLLDRAFIDGTPISGTFELIPTCNMDCKMCYIRISPEEMRRQSSPLTADEWLEIGRQVSNLGTMFLLLTGGEPLLYPEFDKVYEGLRQMGIIVTINTNGTLITKDVVTILQKNVPRRINISLYGASDEVYKELCGNPKGFTQVMQGVCLLKEAGIPVKFNYTLTPWNEAELDRIMEISDELQIPISTPTYMFPPARKIVPHGQGKYRMSPEEAARKQVEIIYKNFHQQDDYKDQILEKLEEIKERPNQEPIDPPGGCLCSAGVSSFWINWKGNLTPCGMMEEPCYSLRIGSFKDGWHQIQEKARQIMTSSKCFQCRYRSICQTCAASAYAETGDFGKEVPYHCEFCNTYEKILWEQIKEG